MPKRCFLSDYSALCRPAVRGGRGRKRSRACTAEAMPFRFNASRYSAEISKQVGAGLSRTPHHRGEERPEEYRASSCPVGRQTFPARTLVSRRILQVIYSAQIEMTLILKEIPALDAWWLSESRLALLMLPGHRATGPAYTWKLPRSNPLAPPHQRRPPHQVLTACNPRATPLP